MRDQFTEQGIVLERAIAFWVQRVQAQLRTHTYRVFREAGFSMTPEQWAVLVRLWERGDMTQTELCDTTLKDKPTISRIVDGMEKQGWVARHPDPDDARTRRVRLTRAGRALEAQLMPLVQSFVADFERGIPEADLAVTRRTLMRLFENLS